MWTHIGMLPPSYECTECGWQERVVLKATNKKLSVQEVELIREPWMKQMLVPDKSRPESCVHKIYLYRK